MTAPLIVGLVIGWAALGAALYAFFSGARRVPLDRRTLVHTTPQPDQVAASTQRVVDVLQQALVRFGRLEPLAEALDSAGSETEPAEYLAKVLGFTAAAAATGAFYGGLPLALLSLVAVPLLAKMMLGFKANRRRAQFADQLDDTLQLLAGSLRAGHSLLRAIAAVATEADEPTASEFNRIVNQTGVGRELGDAMTETTDRTQSQDFGWVAQAVAIHREVGGDLADVLDTVGNTIRERNQIRRQVKALSAEGKMSGIVLIMLPIGIAGFLSISSPDYLGKLTHSFVGWSMIGAAVLMMLAGGFWLKKVVSFKF